MVNADLESMLIQLQAENEALKKQLATAIAKPSKNPVQNEDDAIQLGAICRGSRAWLGWSQKELAEKMNLCTTVIARIEQGNGNPRYTTFQKLMSIFEENGIKILRDDKMFTLKIQGLAEK
jgi:ribosome-binding protein aMBF1 (putative translation factor)